MNGRKEGKKEGWERLMACGLEIVVRVLCLGGLAGGGEIRLGFPDWGILDRGGKRGWMLRIIFLANACVFFFFCFYVVMVGFCC